MLRQSWALRRATQVRGLEAFGDRVLGATVCVDIEIRVLGLELNGFADVRKEEEA